MLPHEGAVFLDQRNSEHCDCRANVAQRGRLLKVDVVTGDEWRHCGRCELCYPIEGGSFAHV